jgi:uncharacterized membrane protein HdeD (DUF308 family)
MACNVGGVERTLRLSLGLALVIVGILMTGSPWTTAILLVIGGILVLTGVVRYCPVNALVGRNSCIRAGGTGMRA